MTNLKTNIKSLLSSKEELNKKQVALFLTQEKIEKLDEIVKTLSTFSNGKVNRNILIEMAIDDLISAVPDVIKEYQQENSQVDLEYDTIICPSMASGEDFFKKNNKWEYIKLDADKIKNIKYIAIYAGTPIKSIRYWGKIEKFEELMIDNQKKYIVYLDGKAKELDTPIKLGNTNPMGVRSIKYTTFKKLLTAKEYSDLN